MFQVRFQLQAQKTVAFECLRRQVAEMLRRMCKGKGVIGIDLAFPLLIPAPVSELNQRQEFLPYPFHFLPFALIPATAEFRDERADFKVRGGP